MEVDELIIIIDGDEKEGGVKGGVEGGSRTLSRAVF